MDENSILEEIQMRKRIILIILLIVVFGAGCWAKLSDNSDSLFWSNKIAGALYVTFWCFFFSLIFPRQSEMKLITIVLVITCSLEFSQLYTNQLFIYVRSTFLGRAFIGSTFSWSDFPWYFIGAILAFIVLYQLKNVH